jgi:hypothetical protein
VTRSPDDSTKRLRLVTAAVPTAIDGVMTDGQDPAAAGQDCRCRCGPFGQDFGQERLRNLPAMISPCPRPMCSASCSPVGAFSAANLAGVLSHLLLVEATAQALPPDPPTREPHEHQ